MIDHVLQILSFLTKPIETQSNQNNINAFKLSYFL